MLGASRPRAWRTVTLPALGPAVAAAALMVFLFTFTSFGVVQILGGPTFSTLEVEIYRQTSEVFDLSTAAVLTIVQFVAVGAILAVHAWTVRRRESVLRLVDPAVTARRPRGAGQWALLAGVVASIAVLLLLPLAVLVQRSLDTADFGYYRALTHDDGGTFLVPPIAAIGNSLEYAVAATAIAVVIGGLAAAALTRRDAGRLVRGFDALLMLPLGVSAVTVGFGFLISLDKPRWICGVHGFWCRSRRRWSASPSSYGRCCPCCGRWTGGCGRRRPSSGRRRGGCGARSICRWYGGRC